MLKFKIIFQLLLFAVISDAQISSTVNIDIRSKDLAILFSQKKFDAALSLVNKLINENSEDGVNYFNRAVIRYYKNPKPIKTYIEDGKKITEAWYDTSVINDCKKAIEKGYKNSETYYLVFLQYYNFNKNAGWVQKYIQDDAFEHKYISYVEQKEFIDSALKVNWNKKYLFAKFELYNNHEIVTTFLESYKDDIPKIKKDCEDIIIWADNKRNKFFANYYLSKLYSKHYLDTLKAINYLSLAIDLNSINRLKPITNKKFDEVYDNLYAERGQLREGLRDFDGAFSDYTTHLIDWEDAEIYYRRAWINYVLNDLNSALSDVTKSIDLREESKKKALISDGYMAKMSLDLSQGELGIAFLLKGLVNKELRNEKESLRDYNKAIEYGNKDAIEFKKELLEASHSNELSSEDTNERTNIVPMYKKGNVYEIPITVNNTLKINFIFDAGASDVSISADVALTLIRTGTVTDKDFIGTQTYRFADGSTAKSKVFILKDLKIGNKNVSNVRATISNSLKAPLLLGQSALNRFGKITIDYKNEVIHFED
jgi:aspartyl protease family protein